MEKFRPLLMFPLAIIALITGYCLFRIAGQVFINPEYDAISLTNIGFVLLLATANILFSWARAIDNVGSLNKGVLNNLAVHSIIGAIFFLLGSLVKYAIRYTHQLWATPFFFTSEIDDVLLHITYWIIFTTALIYVAGIIVGVFWVYLRQSKFKEFLMANQKEVIVEHHTETN